MDSRAPSIAAPVRWLALAGLVFAALAAGTLIGADAARAQSPDTSVLIDRLERMERELITLQRQVYRGGPAPAPAAGGGFPAAPVDGNFAAQTEVRFSQFEGEIRQLTGKIEEIGHHVAQLSARFDKLVSDVDFRLRALEQGGAAAAPQAGATGGQSTGAQAQRAPATAPPARLRGAGENLSQPASTEGVLGALRPGQVPTDAPPPPGTVVRPAPAQPLASLPPGPPEEQYKYAFDILARQRDYEGAERAFRTFLKANPNHALAGNAQYWLGETHYARKEFEKAAVEFAEGFKKYPKDSKAPDNVLKLGMALAALNQSSDACKALQGFDQRFPGDGQNLQTLRERAARERQRLNCR